MATRKVVVEVPEDLVVDRIRVERLARALVFLLASERLSGKLGLEEREVDKIVEEVEEWLRRRSLES